MHCNGMVVALPIVRATDLDRINLAILTNHRCTVAEFTPRDWQILKYIVYKIDYGYIC